MSLISGFIVVILMELITEQGGGYVITQSVNIIFDVLRHTDHLSKTTEH